MIGYYDRDGKQVDQDTWMQLRSSELYSRVALSEMGPYTVSTVWLGLDMSLSGMPPIIFETMVFLNAELHDPEHEVLHDLDCQRYATEQEAHKGHDEMCTLVRATLQETPFEDT